MQKYFVEIQIDMFYAVYLFQLHLFDIDIPGKITFQESKTLTAGNDFVTFDTRK